MNNALSEFKANAVLIVTGLFPSAASFGKRQTPSGGPVKGVFLSLGFAILSLLYRITGSLPEGDSHAFFRLVLWLCFSPVLSHSL